MGDAARTGELHDEAMDRIMNELSSRIARTLAQDGLLNPFPGLYMSRASAPTKPTFATYEPALCVVVQGQKQLVLGTDRYVYDSARYLLNTVPLPVASQVLEASRARPYLCVGIDLDAALVGSVLAGASTETGLPLVEQRTSLRAVDVGRIEFGLLDAVLRLVRLVDSPRDARVLAPLIRSEIVYRLLVGEQGARLAAMASLGGQTCRVAKAIVWVQANFDKPLRVATLAREVGMSPSALHVHFRTVTGMSPLQFQKRLRLQRARHLMLVEDLDATRAGYVVGYNDASQFSREYRRMFGAPPLRHVSQLRRAK